MKHKGLWWGLWVVILLWPWSTVVAADPVGGTDGGQIFVDEDVYLEPGETFRGDLGVLNGDLTMPEGSIVDGDLFLVNGKATMAGRVNGSLAVISGVLELTEGGWVAGDTFTMRSDQEVAGHVQGNLSVLFGQVTLRSTAVIEGDLLVSSGDLLREEGALVLGEQVSELRIPPIPQLPEMPPEMPSVTPPTPPRPSWPPAEASAGQSIGRLIGRALVAAFLGLVFVAVGVLVVVVWPQATRRVADCIAALPLQSFGLGLLTMLIAAGLEVLAVVLMILIILVAAALVATIILIPIGLLLILLSVLVLLPVPLALAGAMVLGWVGLAELIGQKLLRALKADGVSPLGATLVGLLVTVPLGALLWVLRLSCCVWPLGILLASVGLGAVFHTQFGTRDCRRSSTPVLTETFPMEAMEEEAGQPDGPPLKSP